MFRRFFILGGFLLASACIAQPSFDTSNVEPSGSASATADEMVLIPATTFANGGIGPTNKKPEPGKPDKPGKGKGNGNGNGHCSGGEDEGGDNGSPNQNPDCTPAGGSSSGGSGSSGSTPPPSSAPPAETDDPAGSVVGSFWIDAREVSVREYGACVAAGGCTPAGAAAGCTGSAGLGEHPITCVSRAQASAFCAWKQKRLVRDIEWTAASAGAEARAYPWGSERPSAERLNACGSECASSGMYGDRDPFSATAPCGSFPLGRSPQGVLDLAGNVAEWVDAPSGLVRGGSYADVDPNAVSSSAALPVAIDAADPTIGFRCARDP